MSKTTARHYNAGMDLAKGRDRTVGTVMIDGQIVGHLTPFEGGRGGGTSGDKSVYFREIPTSVTIPIKGAVVTTPLVATKAIDLVGFYHALGMPELQPYQRRLFDLIAKCATDIVLSDRGKRSWHYYDYSAIEERMMAFYDESLVVERRPRRAPKVDMAMFDLKMDEFNAPDNVERWATQCAKVMAK